LFTSHPRQSLLYNLLDKIGNVQGIGVIGVTARCDFVELLEKRVRSRLSGRRIMVQQPKSLYEFKKVINQSLGFIENSGELFNNNEIDSIIQRDFEIHRNPRYIVNKILSKCDKLPAVKWPDEDSINGLSKSEQDLLVFITSMETSKTEFIFEDVYEKYTLSIRETVGNHRISRTLLIRAYEHLILNGFIICKDSTYNMPLCFRLCRLGRIPNKL
jgi:hypothetical protein